MIPPPVRRLACAIAVSILCVPTTPADAVERPPVADFVRKEFVRGMTLSPDGLSIAYLSEYGGKTHLCVLTLASDKIARFKVGEALVNGALMPKEVDDFWWVGNNRLVFKTTVWDMLYGSAAIDRDGRNFRGLTWLERDPTGRTSDPAFELIHTFKDGSPRILMLDIKGGFGTAKFFPDVLEVNTETGNSKRVLRNPGNVTSWITDDKGVVRIGIAREKDKSWVTYRDTAGSSWRTLPLPSRGHEKLRPLGFDTLNGTFYVAGFNEQDRWSVFPFDLESASIGEPVASDPIYDTLGGGMSPTFNGVALARPIFSETRGKLVGIFYVAETPRVKWLDPEFERIHAAVDRALPGRVNLLVSQSIDEKRMLFLSFSDRDPGSYHLLDREARTFKPIGACMDWINPAQMSPMLSIHYEARDGETIRGYLTVPVGHEARALPMVVLPHGGPWWRDVWGFDPLVQLIASRGYAVLQMNYRGSRGYGSAFEALGKKQVGGGIQHDIEDATRWAIAAGVADPSRIAIAGGSYGGYSALYALGRSPELYKCGISLNGVTDWYELLDKGSRDPDYTFARHHWAANVGDPAQDEELLRSISPVSFADRITAPTMIIQTRDDRTVPQKQARKMANALSAAGRPAQLVMLEQGGHSIRNQRARLEAFTSIVSFLEEHLGPGVEFRPEN